VRGAGELGVERRHLSIDRHFQKTPLVCQNTHGERVTSALPCRTHALTVRHLWAGDDVVRGVGGLGVHWGRLSTICTKNRPLLEKMDNFWY